ncbi:hypothetical protein KC878_03960 [Candidatus Saccharibacteria bacterium]|nr:hypothetical protein [Candidatus Saccharibacteria bacterium]
MQATAEALVLLSSASGHDCGLVLPGDTSPRLIQAGTCTQVVLAELAKSSAVDGSLDPQLKLLVNQARYVEFAILVLDVHKLGSPEVRSALTSISKHCELVIVEVSDPWDYQLPSLGKVRLRQNGEVKRVDTSDGNTREAYVAMAAERQRSNQEFLRGLGRDVQHHELITSIPFGTQFLSEFAPSPARRAS